MIFGNVGSNSAAKAKYEWLFDGRTASAIEFADGKDISITNTGTVTLSGGVLQFNDTNYLSFPEANGQLGADDFSLKVRFKATTIPDGTADWAGIVGLYDAATDDRSWLIRIGTATGLEFFRSNDGTTGTLSMTAATTIVTGVWYNVEIRRVGAVLYLLVDGVVEDSDDVGGAYTFFATTGATTNVGTYAPGTRNFDGEISNFSLSKTVIVDDPLASLVRTNSNASFYADFSRAVKYQDSTFTTLVSADAQTIGAVRDLSRAQNHLTQGAAASEPLWVAADGAIDIDGATEDWLILASSRPSDTAQTYITRFKCESTAPAAFQILIGCQGGLDRSWLSLTDTNGYISAGVGDDPASSVNYPAGGDLRDDSWHTGGVSWDASNIYLYLDGALVLTYTRTTGTGGPASRPITVGARNNASTDGTVVDLPFYGAISHALSDQRVFSAAEHALIHERWSQPPAAIHHYDLSLGDYTVSTTDITVIPDQIGTANLNTTVSTAWPQTGTTINGKDVADFVSAGNDIIYADSGVSTSLSGTDVPYSLAAVVQSDNASQDAHVFAFNTNTAGQAYVSHFHRGTSSVWSSIRRDDAGNPSGTIDLGPAPTTNPTVVVWVYQTETLTFYVNGVQVYQNQVYDDPETVLSNLNRLTMGAWRASTGSVFGPFDGKIGEVKIWDQALTSAQVRKLNDALKIKWGIQ